MAFYYINTTGFFSLHFFKIFGITFVLHLDGKPQRNSGAQQLYKPPTPDVCLLRFLTPESGVTADATFGARGGIFLDEGLGLGRGIPGSPGG